MGSCIFVFETRVDTRLSYYTFFPILLVFVNDPVGQKFSFPLQIIELQIEQAIHIVIYLHCDKSSLNSFITSEIVKKGLAIPAAMYFQC